MMAQASTRRLDLADTLRSEILTGKRRPGTKLVERAIAVDAGVPRLAVAAGLRKLSREGLVEMSQQRSAIVIGMSPADIADLNIARERFSCFAVRSATAKKTPSDLERLRRTLERCRETSFQTLDEFVDATRAFRESIVLATHDQVLIDVLERLGQRSQALLPVRVSRAVVLESLTALCRAISDGDAESAEGAIAAMMQTFWAAERQDLIADMRMDSAYSLDVPPEPLEAVVPSSGLESDVETVVAELREQIITGRLTGGTPLRERSIADRFQLSRTPVRQAITTLISEKLAVSHGPRVAATVAFMGAGEAAAIGETQLVLDVLATRDAATRRSIGDLRELHSNVMASAGFLRTGDDAGLMRTIIRWRRIVMAASANRTLWQLDQLLNGRIARRIAMRRDQPYIVSRHIALYKAIERRDPTLVEEIITRQLHESQPQPGNL